MEDRLKSFFKDPYGANLRIRLWASGRECDMFFSDEIIERMCDAICARFELKERSHDEEMQYREERAKQRERSK